VGSAVLVTGATGFIGRQLVKALLVAGAKVSILVRHPCSRTWSGKKVEEHLGDLSQRDKLSEACRNVDTIFHLAGYAHAWKSSSGEVDQLQQRVNVDGTRALLEEASNAGVRKFIFFSSVKAVGEGGSECIDEAWKRAPNTAYGCAKLKAEGFVLEAGHNTKMHVCNLRLTLVYGSGVKGNLQRMIVAIEYGRFPPLPETGNKRSMVHVNDVVQATLLAVTSPRANGKTYIVTDDQTYSTYHIYRSICQALGKRVPRWSIPIFFLRAIAKIGDLVGIITRRRFVFDSDALEKLLGSAWYSAEKIKRELGYRPKHAFDDAVEEMVTHYKGQRA
jgi:nucleoside-diphosphate-sugar epimerase